MMFAICNNATGSRVLPRQNTVKQLVLLWFTAKQALLLSIIRRERNCLLKQRLLAVKITGRYALLAPENVRTALITPEMKRG
ncbi:MAG: hypothetical protein LBU45_07600 [Azoarcus sp.]|jgi:hypothetical protein|nr:hypothetical protein [Azoarcus sp.]